MSYEALLKLATNEHKEIQPDWMPVTAIRPLIFGDPALIWLKYFGKENGFEPDKSPYDFLDFISAKARQFEDKWISEFAPHAVVVCVQDFEGTSIGKLLETIGHMQAKVPVIAKPALWWGAERIYGVPDLIVHTSWLEEKFPQLISSSEKSVVAANLPGKGLPGHYLVLDIKFTTGLQDSDKKKDYENYASQVRLYSYMLGQLQGAMPSRAFLVTRDLLSKPLPVQIVSALGDRLDKDLAELRDLVMEIKLRGSKYKPWTDSIVASNLSNQDETWSTSKKQIANVKFPGRDPALLYQVSLSVKQQLAPLGFPSLDSILAVDPANIPFEKCKGLGPKRSKIMRAIVQANRSGMPIRPAVGLVPAIRPHEFFVDYEYFTNVNVDFEKQWPTLEGHEMIFMIGVGTEQNGKWSFISFLAGAETREKEEETFLAFLDHLRKETEGALDDPSQTVLYHWTSAEVWQSQRACDRFGFPQDHSLRRLPWVDLQKPFLEGPAAVPLAWGYGLKEIAKAISQLDPQFSVQWPEGLDEGLRAMVMGWRAYQDTKPLESKEMELLRKYLEIDCAAMCATLNWLRRP